MHKEVLRKKTERILEQIGKIDIAKDFYLAGGTALALQIGHRKSIDLDWFSKSVFSTASLKNALKELGEFKVNEEEKDTLNCVLDEVKLSFFEYPYEAFFPFISFGNVKLADKRDIACMKIDAISSRGSKKDFVDIYFLLKELSLGEILDLFDKKYNDIHYNRLHILKSLTYFEEADKEPMPNMIKDVKWRDIKKEIVKKASEI